ncbi:MAG: ABC transporter ATP-binding protein [Bacilli bacterium]|nr:ABC transporter ATP-binding protein [Bacilli bacterium]MEE3344630.1 ABC transporter ATP-binding protein [Bacilli bacterium]
MGNIKTVNLIKEFGEKDNKVRVLDDIDIEIKDGEFVSLMGPSGSGKSTLLYLVGGLDKPTKGKVLINGKDISKLSDNEMSKLRRRDIGFVFQFYNLVQNLTVEENIMLPVVMNGEKESNYKERLDYILKTIGLEDKRKSLPKELSGGQQQRVSIARAVILNPSIIFADEPIGNLDSKSGKEVMELFKKINEEEHITILQVTHSEESAKYGNRIIRLKDGKIV